jgi:hypothetical protein
MNTPIILGVDPGATGCLAGLDAATGHLIWVEAMPMLAGLSIVSGPEVPPEVWKPAVGLRKVAGESKAGAKARARAMATSLWPDRSAWFASVAKGTAAAEAALIARHGWLLRNRERVA